MSFFVFLGYQHPAREQYGRDPACRHGCLRMQEMKGSGVKGSWSRCRPAAAAVSAGVISLKLYITLLAQPTSRGQDSVCFSAMNRRKTIARPIIESQHKNKNVWMCTDTYACFNKCSQFKCLIPPIWSGVTWCYIVKINCTLLISTSWLTSLQVFARVVFQQQHSWTDALRVSEPLGGRMAKRSEEKVTKP